MNSTVTFLLLVGSLVLTAAGAWLTCQLKWKPLMKSLEKFPSERKE